MHSDQKVHIDRRTFLGVMAAATPVECLHYAMNLPTSTVITGIDSMEIVKQDLEAVKTFQPLTENQVADLLARAAQAACRGKFEGFKTTNSFDGTPRTRAGWGKRIKDPLHNALRTIRAALSLDFKHTQAALAGELVCREIS